MNVRYSRRSLAQIAEILELFAEDSPSLASRFAQRLEMLAELLARIRRLVGAPILLMCASSR